MRKIICFCLFLFLGACASTTQSYLDNIQNDFANGNFEASEKSIEEQNNLDLLIDGIALFHADKYEQSDLRFEEFNKRNLHETSTSLSREAAGLLLGGGVNSYKPYMMDSLFVSYYQIWDLLAMHDWANARVVINQSYARQQNMSIEYKKMIEENKNKISSNTEINQLIDKNTADWVVFSDIMNPALMYLSGIYFLNDGDFDNAITYLKRANGMMPENTFIKQDLEYAQKRIAPKNTTWHFIDSGFAPRLREQNTGIFLPNIGMVYFSFSEPYLNNDSGVIKSAQLLANVDAMFMTEYREYQTNEILRSFTSAASKATLQATMYNSSSDSAPILGILSSIYTVASSNTDVRTWATLPKYIYVLRETKSSDSKNNLIYTRIINGRITDNKTINLK
ncbi:MAG: hypothetical protein II843_03860 [Alphaproteobacteria bacterium]|nr:hypothetical protein [Alphaproteobacteria bacterium]